MCIRSETFSLRMILFHVALELLASLERLINANRAFEVTSWRRRLIAVHVAEYETSVVVVAVVVV